MNLVYIKGFSDTEIGQLLNISQQAVSKTHKKALKNIREYIETHKDKKGGI
ncbi:sigma factor-like helix-turn-helix DNA-binding protein [Lysinibacillus mangiferihumi]|uniref:sigma factor-like helix-turn-helix DNA-binding protein n=1 Tax=Lysinibacillus mangiferihumi TaxID=1130819 RepID=UPI003D15F6EA